MVFKFSRYRCKLLDETYSSYSLSVLADMDSGDTAYMAIYQQDGGAQTDISTGSYFGGYLVC